jgi:protein-disulfide isomerase
MRWPACSRTEQVRVLADQIFFAEGSPVGGNPDGDVTLVEFFDYNCGYCKRVMPAVEAVAEADPNLRIVYKEFPILSEGSMIAARAALASRAQDLYEPFHEALMGFEGRIGESEVFAIAEGVGLDVEQLREDMGSDAVTAEIAANMDLARALQINGTPAFVVGDQVIPGAVPQAQLESAIAEARGS